MTNIRVSGSRMTSDGNNIASQLENIDTEIKELEEAMRNLAACWEGPAWNAFQAEVADAIANMKEIGDFFAAYLDALGESKNRYLQAENENRDRMRRVRV